MLITLEKDNVVLTDWNILQSTTKDGLVSEHFIGFSTKDCLGRLSTQIQFYDEEAASGATESGSTYSTTGKPGLPHDDAMYVLERYIGHDAVKNLLALGSEPGPLRFKYLIE